MLLDGTTAAVHQSATYDELAVLDDAAAIGLEARSVVSAHVGEGAQLAVVAAHHNVRVACHLAREELPRPLDLETERKRAHESPISRCGTRESASESERASVELDGRTRRAATRPSSSVPLE